MTSNNKTPVGNVVNLFQNLTDDQKCEFSHRIIHEKSPDKESQKEWLDPWEKQRFTLKEAFKPLPAVQYVAENIFALPSLSVIYGAPGTLKSMLAFDLIVSIVKGGVWLLPLPGKSGVQGIKTLQSPAMWVDNDNGIRIMHERMAAFARARDLPPDSPLYYYSMPTPRLDGNSPQHIEDLIHRAIELKVKVIVVDNLGTISCSCEENSSQMVAVMANLRRVAEETGAAVILIHHQRKNGGFKGRTGESLRGHSSIEASLDTALLVMREEGENEIKIKATKVRGPEIKPFQAIFKYDCQEGTRDLYKAKFYGLSLKDGDVDQPIDNFVIASLSKGAKNKTQLADDVKVDFPDMGKNKIRDHIEEMVNEDKIILLPGGKPNEKMYGLKPEDSNNNENSSVK